MQVSLCDFSGPKLSGRDKHLADLPRIVPFRVITAQGQAVCWGSDTSGQSSPPGDTFTAIAAGAEHTCGLTTGGGLLCWGADNVGQSTPPAGVFTSMATGDNHTCALDAEGLPSCWGSDSPDESLPPHLTDPPKLSFAVIAAGPWHTCGLDTEGQVTCWKGYGYIGDGGTPPDDFPAP